MKSKSNKSILNQIQKSSKTLNKTNETERKNEHLQACPLKNNIGENSSYINSVIQSIYQLNAFRTAILNDDDLDFSRNVFLLSELKEILKKYEYNLKNQSLVSERFFCLETSDFRLELERLFKPYKKFIFNKLDSPIELILALLNSLHCKDVNASELSIHLKKSCSNMCLSHKFFHLDFSVQSVCECGLKSQLLTSSQNEYTVKVSVKDVLNWNDFLLKISQNEKDNLGKVNDEDENEEKSFHELDFQLRFERIYKNISKNDNKDLCFNRKCEYNNIKTYKYLHSVKDNILLSIDWNEKLPKLIEIFQFFLLLPIYIKNSTFFTITNSNDLVTYRVSSIICYWNYQYISILKDENENDSWTFCEDSVIFKFSSYKQLLTRLFLFHYHPVLVVYTKVHKEIQFDFYKNSDLVNDEDYDVYYEYCSKYNHKDGTNHYMTLYKKSFLEAEYEVAPVKYVEIVSRFVLEKEKEKEKERDERKEEVLLEKNKYVIYKDNKSSLNIISINNNNNDNNNNDNDNDKEDITTNKVSECNTWRCVDCFNYNSLDKYQCMKCFKINVNIYEIVSNNKEINKEEEDKEFTDKNKVLLNEILKNHLKIKENPWETKEKSGIQCKTCLFFNKNHDFCQKCYRNLRNNDENPSNPKVNGGFYEDDYFDYSIYNKFQLKDEFSYKNNNNIKILNENYIGLAGLSLNMSSLYKSK